MENSGVHFRDSYRELIAGKTFVIATLSCEACVCVFVCATYLLCSERGKTFSSHFSSLSLSRSLCGGVTYMTTFFLLIASQLFQIYSFIHLFILHFIRSLC